MWKTENEKKKLPELEVVDNNFASEVVAVQVLPVVASSKVAVFRLFY